MKKTPRIPGFAYVHDMVDRRAIFQGFIVTAILYVCVFTALALSGSDTEYPVTTKPVSDTVRILPQGTDNSQAAAIEQEHVPPAHQDDHPQEAASHAAQKHDLFETYRRKFTPTGNPLIAIIVSDYGLSSAASDYLLKNVPPDVSLILSSYADRPKNFEQKARRNGHEIWLGLPVETADYPTTDPGPQALISNDGLQTNQKRLNWVLSRASTYAGVAAPMDDSFNSAPTLIQKLFGDIFDHGLGYFDINPKAPSSLETIAVGRKAPYARNAVFLDSASFKSLEAIAKEKGYVIGVVPPYPGRIDALKIWIDTLEAKKLSLAPLSAIAERTTK